MDSAEHVVIGGFPEIPEEAGISSLVMTEADGRVVHEGQDPQGAVPGLSAFTAYPGALEQFFVGTTHAGVLTFATASVTGVGTSFESVPVTPGPGPIALAGFLHLGLHNITVAMDDGSVRYLVRDQSGSWHDRGVLDTGSGRRVVGLSSYVSPRDGYGHVIVVYDDGDIIDLRLSPDANAPEPTFRDVRANVPRPVAAAGYFGPDNYHHVYVATEDGEIHEIWYPGVATAGQGGVSVRSGFAEVVDIAAYALETGRFQVVAATRDGRILEVTGRTQ